MEKVKVQISEVGDRRNGLGFCNFAFQGDGISKWRENISRLVELERIIPLLRCLVGSMMCIVEA